MHGFLQRRFVVNHRQLVAAALVHFRKARVKNRLLNETMRHFQAAIEEQGGNDSLQSIHQQRSLAPAAAPFLAFSKAKVLSNPQCPCRTKQMAGADQVRAQLGKFSLLVFRKTLEKFPADHESQDRVAEKFHLLVIGCQSRSSPRRVLRLQLTSIGSVSYGLLQKSPALEAMSESFLQRGEVMRSGVHLHSLVWVTAAKKSRSDSAGLNLDYPTAEVTWSVPEPRLVLSWHSGTIAQNPAPQGRN